LSVFSSQVVVSPFGEVASDKYLDPATGKVLTFDHSTGQFTGETDQKQILSEAVDSYRKAIQDNVFAYIQSNYKEGKVAASVYGTDDGKITVCISAKNTKLSACWYVLYMLCGMSV